MNEVLYRKAMYLCRLPYRKERITGATADGYLLGLMEQTDAEWIVNIDEDAFVCDLAALQRLIDHCVAEGYDNCGMPDGGAVKIRDGNPLVTNPFFNIFHTGHLHNAYNPDSMTLESIEGHFPEEAKNWIKQPYDYGNTTEEPFYPLLLWMGSRRRTLYLRAYNHSDGISTVLCNHLGEPFLIHTWYSRFYNHDRYHTRRINRAFREACRIQGLHYRTPLRDIAACIAEQVRYRAVTTAVAVKHALVGKKKQHA